MAGNFDFVRAAWPTVHEDCAKAESYLTSDPRSACFYSRRAIEVLVAHLYDLLALPEPYKRDLAARTNAPRFKQVTGPAINAKLNLVRGYGNDAVHKPRPVRPEDARAALDELFHIMVWAVFHHSTEPDAAPTRSQFDPALAAQAAPLTRDEVVRLNELFARQDAEHAAALQALTEENARLQTELEAKRAAVAAAQAAYTAPDDHDYTEDETRDRFIDRLLREAGWPLDQPRDREHVVGTLADGTTGRADYVLWGDDGLPLAVVEAKRTRRSALEGQEQARQYADALERTHGRRPVIFSTNGYTHHLWDDAAGYPPREVQGFYRPGELELLVARRTQRQRLDGRPIDTAIAGRPYQQAAIAAVDATFDAKQRDALLVMATGTGKTRTVIALVDQLAKAGWVKNVLFLADRQTLAKQARDAFKALAPQTSPVYLVDDKHGTGRVYTSTYQTMMGLIQAVDDDGQRRFGPGFFDLVVIDEAHRSVYAKYGAIFEYFDSLLLGLTATPKDEVDHNTYRLFHLEDGVPTYAYPLDQAVQDGYLVPAKTIAVSTLFLTEGLRYADLSDEERDEWDALDWGDDGPPDEVDPAQVNRTLYNSDTIDKVLSTLMTDGRTIDDGDRLGKTIIFAKNQRHAELIADRFNAGWPEYGGTFARVITHATSHADTLIDNFKARGADPHIAISVDMLDTGVDVPDVVNLVLFKQVRSKSKFWQMLGRGTRLSPDLYGPGRDKEDFVVFDWCGNLEFFAEGLPGSVSSTQKSLGQRVVEERLAVLGQLCAGDRGTWSPGADELRDAIADALHRHVTGMTLENVLVRPHRADVERFSSAEAWQSPSADDLVAAARLAGLPSAATVAGDVEAKRFDLLVLKAQHALLVGDGRTLDAVRAAVQQIAADLLSRTAIPAVAAQAPLLDDIAGDTWWVDVTLGMLETARVRLRDLARLIERSASSPVYTDFEDTLMQARDVTVPGETPGTDLSRFEAKAAAYLRDHLSNIALEKVRRNRPLTRADLDALEAMLLQVGSPDAVSSMASGAGGLGLFVRKLVGLDRAAAQEAFADFLDGSRYQSNQIHFINLIIDELTRHGTVQPDALFTDPFSFAAPAGDPTLLFPDTEFDAIVTRLTDIQQSAIA